MTGGIRKRGDSYYYYFDLGIVGGKRKKIERFGGKTKKEAESLLRKTVNEYERAGSLFEPSEITVADFFDYWMNNYVIVNLRFNTREAYRVIIENHIKPTLGYYKVKNLSPAILQEFVNSKYLSGFAKHYLNNLIAVMSGALKYAVYPAEFIKSSPMLYVKMPKYEISRKELGHKLLSQEDYKKVMERFPVGNPFHMPLLVGYYTGFRIGEVTSMTWDDIDLDSKTITVDKSLYKRSPSWYIGPAKTESSNRTISIGDTLVSALHIHKHWQIENRLKYGQHGYHQFETEEIDPDNGKPMRRVISLPVSISAGVMKPLNFVCTKESGEMVTSESYKYAARVIHYELGIDCAFHSLRHTHATILIQQGAIPKDVQKRLGHSDVSITLNTYTHDTEVMSKQTVKIFETYTSELK